jgi:hypothetical protein
MRDWANGMHPTIGLTWYDMYGYAYHIKRGRRCEKRDEKKKRMEMKSRIPSKPNVAG